MTFYNPFLRRSPLKRHTPLKARKGLNKISPKTAEMNRLWNKLVTYLVFHRAKGLCEVRATDECKARKFKPDWRGLSGHHIIRRYPVRIDTAGNCIIGCGDCHNHDKFPEGIPISRDSARKIIAENTAKMGLTSRGIIQKQME